MTTEHETTTHPLYTGDYLLYSNGGCDILGCVLVNTLVGWWWD